MTTTIARLRIVGDALPNISEGAGDGMDVFLEEPGSVIMTSRIGAEILTGRRHLGRQCIDVTRGPSYPSPRGGTVTGGRYLLRESGPGTRIIGALNYTLMAIGTKREAVLSNLVVASDHRRKGIATRLLEELLVDFPGARADSSMTTLGAAFMGYSANGSEPARKPRP